MRDLEVQCEKAGTKHGGSFGMTFAFDVTFNLALNGSEPMDAVIARTSLITAEKRWISGSPPVEASGRNRVVSEIAVAVGYAGGFLGQSGIVAKYSIGTDPCLLFLTRSPSRPTLTVANRQVYHGVRISCQDANVSETC